MVGACALCMLVIGFSETLIFELPHALGKPDSFVGVLMAVQGIGAIAGALTATRAIARHGELRAAGFGMTIFALGALLMADSALPVVLAGKILFGLGLPWIVVAMLTLLQRRRPRTCRAGRSPRASSRWARRRRCQSPSGRHWSRWSTIALYCWSKPRRSGSRASAAD